MRLWSAHLFVTNFQIFLPLSLRSVWIHSSSDTHKKFLEKQPIFRYKCCNRNKHRTTKGNDSPSVNRNLFLEKFESKTPITLGNLSKSSKSRITFFNTNYGSNIEFCDNIEFWSNPQQVIYMISEVLDMLTSGNFDVIGQLHWVEEPRKVSVAQQK